MMVFAFCMDFCIHGKYNVAFRRIIQVLSDHLSSFEIASIQFDLKIFTDDSYIHYNACSSIEDFSNQSKLLVFNSCFDYTNALAVSCHMS